MNGLQKFTELTPTNSVNINEELFIHLEIITKIFKEIVRILRLNVMKQTIFVSIFLFFVISKST